MKNLNDKFAACVRVLVKRLGYPHEVKTATVHVECVDGKEFEIPVNIGNSSQRENAGRRLSSESGNKKKLLEKCPRKDEEPKPAKAICSLAGLDDNDWNRNLLWDLVEEGEIVSLKTGFRKAK